MSLNIVIQHARGATYGAVHIVPGDLTGYTLTSTVTHASGTTVATAELIDRKDYDPFWFESAAAPAVSAVQVEIDATDCEVMPVGMAQYDVRAALSNRVAMMQPTWINLLQRITA